MEITQFLPLIILLVVFVGMSWYFGVRPMRQREKEHDRMVIDLQKGDRVITAGGIYGKVDTIYEDSIILEVESGAKIRVTKGGVVKKEGE
jgi:preprotein translocase subunit YajC